MKRLLNYSQKGQWLVAALLLSAFSAFAQPVNDDCLNAISLGTLPTPGPCVAGLEDGAPVVLTNQSTTGATGLNPYIYQVGCQGGGSMTAPALDTWYSFTASGTTVNVDISGFPNANIAVWSGTCGNLAGNGCAIANGAGNGSLIVTQTNPGQLYYIQVSGGTATATDPNFTLSVDNDIDCDDCLTMSSLTATPLPTAGAYTPGQVVTFCFEVTGWDQQNTNWIHGVQIDFGAGWTGLSNPVPSITCQFGGTWAYYPAGIGVVNGTNWGPGFYFDSDGDGDPTNNFGDNCQGTGLPWEFCWDMTVGACSPGADLSMTVNTSGDGESGSWTSPACDNDAETSFSAFMVCCDLPLTTSIPETCPGDGDGTATALGQGGTAPYDYVWENSSGTVLLTDLNNFGVSTLPNITSGVYTVTVTDDLGCVQVIDVVVYANACVGCPGYATTPTALNVACGGQLFDFEVPNTTCNGTMIFDVIGNYGSAWANEITWNVTSNLTGNVLASGGPGTNGGAINNTVSVDPNIEGTYFTLNVFDSYGDGFNGVGGFIQIEDNGSIIAGPITGDFGSSTYIIFGANIDISSSTLTVTTPSGNVTNVAYNCDDHDLQFTLDNINFCNPINIDLPWVIICDSTGGVISSGIHNVTVYPQIATAATDVVTVTWNDATCQWDVQPQNDCDLSDIGTVFNITPDPTAWPANTCNNGSQDFTVDYLGVSGGPDCCLTGGPLGPITYNTSTAVGDATVASSPFGGTNNSAYVNIPGSGSGGAATSMNLTVSMSGYCYDDLGSGNSYWVTIYIDGVIIWDQQYFPPPAGFTENFDLTSFPGYDQNSVIEVYIYPNTFSGGAPPTNTTYVPGVPCASLNNGQWTAGSIDVTLDATYTEQSQSPAICTFTDPSAYTCCIVDPPIVPADGASTVNCVADAQVQPAGPGVITDACGNTLTPTITAPTPVACEGTMDWLFTYIDCDSNIIDWTYTYTVDMPTFTLPANGGSTVNCVANAQVQPAGPGVINDACGNALTPVITPPVAVACEGTMDWIFTYTDCAGQTLDWTYTYTVDMPIFTLPANAGSTVNCVTNAQVQPTPPAGITDACGTALTPVVTAPAAVACEGTMAWVFTYTDCAGQTLDWTYTYTVDMPIFTLPANAGSTVNCVADAQVQPTPPAGITDACGTALTPVVTAPTAVACEGAMAWVFTYTDCAGQTLDWTYTYTVDMPAFTLGFADAGSTVNCVADAQVQPTPPAAVNDACGTAITPVVTAPAAVACEGPMAWVFTYTDCAGNTLDWTYTYTVDMPAFTLGFVDAGSTVNCVADAQVQPTPPAAVNDACGTAITPVVTAPAAVACEGTMAWVFTYTDCAGNSLDWTYTYTVDMPAFTLGFVDAGSTVNCVADAQVQPTPPAAVNDACGNVLTPVVTAPAAVACEGTMAWVFTYTDCAGNTLDWTYTYTVDMPLFTVPADGGTTVNCVADAQVQPAGPGPITDACGNVLTPAITSPVAVACEGTMDWIFTYTDCAGQSVDWTYTYTIDMPVFTVPANAGTTVNCVADAQVQPAGPGTVNDACGNALTPVITAPAAVACEGAMAWIFTYTDCAGQSVDWTYTYTVDMPAFVVGTPNGSESLDCIDDVYVPTPPAGINDACGNPITPTMVVGPDPGCVGAKVYTFTYTDCAGNSADWTYTFNINDSIAPTGTAPANISIPGGAAPAPDVTLITDEMDNCDPTPSVTFVSDSSDGGTCPEIIYRTYRIEDNCGNFIEVVQTITIGDAIMPTASNPLPIDVECAADVPAPDPLVVTDEWDNGATPVVTFEVDSTDGNSCPEVITRWYRVTDDCGNFIFVSQTITIMPVTPPVAPANGGSTVNCVAAAQVQPTSPVITDVCGDTIVPTVVVPAAVACEGTMDWVFTYTDCAGQSVDWTYTYTIDMPIFTLPADAGSTVNCVADAQVQPTPPAGITDACGTALTPVVTAPAAVACEGTMAWVFTYIDCAGQTLDWTYTYTVDMPAFTVPADAASTVNCVADAQVQPAGPGPVTDACGNTLTPVITAPAAVACEGTMAWVFTYTDCAGATLDWTYTYTVDMPAFTLPADAGTTVNCVADAQVQPTPPAGITDACGTALTPVVTAPAAVACEGTMAWVFTYTDCAGQTLDWTYTYTVDMPTFTLPADGSGTVPCPADAQVQPTPPAGIVDACGNALTPTVTVPSVSGCTGLGIDWIFTYTDCAGNTADWTYTYTVNMPAFTLPFTDDGMIVDCVADAQVQPTPPATVNDMCGNAIVPTITAPTPVACEGIMAWVFTYTDCAGNTLDWTYTYTVDMPAFLPLSAGGNTVNCVADAMVQPAAPPMTDVCGNALTAVVTAPAAIACEGTMDWTFTYTDCAGNSFDWIYTYVVDMPAFTLGFADAGSTVNCVADAQVQPTPPATVNDACGNVLTPTVTAPVAVACEGTMAWVFTYTDCAGETLDWTYTYTVDMPAFTLPADAGNTVNCVADAQVQPTPPAGITDACGNALTPVVTAPAAVACEGTMAWVFTYTDCAGQTLDWTYTYTVDMPAFTLPADAASTVNCIADAQVQPTPPTGITDACGNALAPVVTAPAAVACEGTMAWVFTYTDCAGQSLDWTYTYTVDMPAFTVPANAGSTVNCVADAQVQPAGPGPVNDACGNALTPVITAPTPVACEGTMDWVFTYTDCAGQTLDWTYTYTVDMPAFTLPADGASTVNCVSDAQVQPTPPASITDACGNAMTPVVSAPTPIACEGTMDWVFTYTDCAGQTLDWTYTYTVDMPAFTLPADGASTVNCVSDAQVQPTPPAGITDACGNALTPVVSTPAAIPCEGTMAWVFTYTDCAGETLDWTFTYTVDMPVFTLPADITEAVDCIDDVYVPTPPAGITDACGNALVPVMVEGPDPVCVGNKVYTFTYTDCAGNTADWTHTFAVNDNIDPTASNPAPISVPGAGDVPVPDPTVVTDEADNCTTNPTVVWVSDVSDGNICNGEIITRTYSVTDDCGNQILVTQEITILATYPPIDAGNDTTICLGASITLTADNPTGAPIVWNNGVTDGVPFSPTTTMTYTVTADNLGCISTDSVTVVVEEPPVPDFYADVVSGCAPLTVTFTNTTTSGSPITDCVWTIPGSGPIVGCGPITYTFYSGGLYDVTLTTTTATGCSASITYDDYIYVESLPNASFTYSPQSVTTLNTEVDFTNTSTGADSYLWDFGDYNTSTEENPSNTYPEDPNSYVVELVAYSPLGCTDTAWATIHIQEELIYYVPNSFTPDDDEFNDLFKAIFTSGYDPYDFHMMLFNRWGQLIWESYDVSVGWDGTYNGIRVQDGTYTWKIDFKTTMTDERKLITGHVNVLK